MTVSFTSLPIDIHFSIGEYLSPLEQRLISQTCQAAQSIYRPFSQQYVKAYESLKLQTNEIEHVYPTEVLLTPERYSWFSPKHVRELFLHYRHFEASYYQKNLKTECTIDVKKYPLLSRVFVDMDGIDMFLNLDSSLYKSLTESDSEVMIHLKKRFINLTEIKNIPSNKTKNLVIINVRTNPAGLYGANEHGIFNTIVKLSLISRLYEPPFKFSEVFNPDTIKKWANLKTIQIEGLLWFKDTQMHMFYMDKSLVSISDAVFPKGVTVTVSFRVENIRDRDNSNIGLLLADFVRTVPNIHRIESVITPSIVFCDLFSAFKFPDLRNYQLSVRDTLESPIFSSQNTLQCVTYLNLSFSNNANHYVRTQFKKFFSSFKYLSNLKGLNIRLPSLWKGTIEVCEPFVYEVCRSYLDSPGSVDDAEMLFDLAKNALSKNPRKKEYASYDPRLKSGLNMFKNDVSFPRFYQAMHKIYSSWDSVSRDTLVIKELIGSILDPNKTMEDLTTENVIDNFAEYCFSEAMFFNIKTYLTSLEHLTVLISYTSIFPFQLSRMLRERSSLKQVYLTSLNQAEEIYSLLTQSPSCVLINSSSLDCNLEPLRQPLT